MGQFIRMYRRMDNADRLADCLMCRIAEESFSAADPAHNDAIRCRTNNRIP